MKHILFSRIAIIGDIEFESIASEPVSVFPENQKIGIGGKLIQEGLSRAKMLGFESVVVLGHKDYYPEFGFGEHQNGAFAVLSACLKKYSWRLNRKMNQHVNQELLSILKHLELNSKHNSNLFAHVANIVHLHMAHGNKFKYIGCRETI